MLPRRESIFFLKVDAFLKIFAKLVCDAPKRGTRITNIFGDHPVFYDSSKWQAALGLAGNEDEAKAYQQSKEGQDRLAEFAKLSPFFRQPDPAFFQNLLDETHKWLLPVGETGAVGISDQEDALPDEVWNNRYNHVRLATQYAEGEVDPGDDEVQFYQQRPQLGR